MKKIILFILLLFLTNYIFAVKLGTLDEVLKPDMIDVSGNELYVLENGGTISVYSLKSLHQTRKFGKTGEGPGEVKVTPFYTNRIILSADNIAIDSIDKLVLFSKEGRLLKELNKSAAMGNITPVGNCFLAGRMRTGEDREFTFQCVTLYNSNMEVIKDLFCQEDVWKNNKLKMVLDTVGFRVYEDKIFIEESPEGFLIEVFDYRGERLYRVERDYEKIKLTPRHKEEIINDFKNEPFIKRMGWEAAKRNLSMKYPDTFPAIREFEVSDKKIYVCTYKVVDNKNEYIVLDLKGKFIRKIYLPGTDKTTLMARLAGLKLHTIRNGTFYYLVEDEVKEVWELHAEVIKK